MSLLGLGNIGERIVIESGATLKVRTSAVQGVLDLSHVLHAVGLQLLSWSFGLSAVLAFLDSRSGPVRDHPPLGWRVAGMLSGPLAGLGCLALLAGGAERWVWLGLALPYATMALVASWTWLRRVRFDLRRQRGREAAILGLIAVLFASLCQTGGDQLPALSLAASLGTAALAGGLGILALCSAVGGERDEVEVEADCDGIPVRAIATGLGITFLAATDVGRGLLLGGITLQAPLGFWLAGSLLLPLALLLVGQRRASWNCPALSSAACAAALIGQFALQTALIA